MSLILPIDKFLPECRSSKPLLIDARSPSEYNHAHIPGAINLPLLNDEHRAIVGKTFKKLGREAAVMKGFDLVGPRFGDIVREVKSQTTGREVFVYCWRGGLRSNIIGWILSTGGFRTTVLKAGYKSYRRWVLEELNKPRTFHVLGGRTGSGKTEVLNAMGKYVHVVDLEAHAHHKGSAFGHLGQLPQPGNETYENILAEIFSAIPLNETIWLENESRNIGSVKLPDKIYEGIRDSFTVEMILGLEERKKRILKEYGIFPAALLAETTKRVRKRLGEVRLREAIGYLEEGNLDAWTELMLVYYDRMYNFGMEQRQANSVLQVDINPLNDADAAARKILDSVSSFKIKQPA